MARSLALRSDVLVENCRSGVRTRLGLGPAELLAEQPGLVWCSISGLCHTGPGSPRPVDASGLPMPGKPLELWPYGQAAARGAAPGLDEHGPAVRAEFSPA